VKSKQEEEEEEEEEDYSLEGQFMVGKVDVDERKMLKLITKHHGWMVISGYPGFILTRIL
jgi:hypothetical protein